MRALTAPLSKETTAVHDLPFPHDIALLFGAAPVVIAAGSRLHLPPPSRRRGDDGASA